MSERPYSAVETLVNEPWRFVAAQKARLIVRLTQLAVMLLVVLGFAALSAAFPLFPTPLVVLDATLGLVRSGEIYPHLSITLYETGVGFGIAVIAGVAIGLSLESTRVVGEIFEPLILAVYSVPKIILLPIFLAIFGVGLEAKIANAAIHGVFPIILNTVAGVREVDPTLRKMARSMNASRWQVFQKIVFPSMALPVFSGMRIGLGFAVLGTLLAELFEASVGLGFLVMHYFNSAQMDKMLAVILFVFLLTMVLNAAMQSLEQLVRKKSGQ